MDHVLKIHLWCFDREPDILGCLANLKKMVIIWDYIVSIEQFIIMTKGLGDSFCLECFISGLKEVIQANVQMHHPGTWLEACSMALGVEVALNSK